VVRDLFDSVHCLVGLKDFVIDNGKIKIEPEVVMAVEKQFYQQFVIQLGA
jgi:hypothetical protein